MARAIIAVLLALLVVQLASAQRSTTQTVTVGSSGTPGGVGAAGLWWWGTWTWTWWLPTRPLLTPVWTGITVGNTIIDGSPGVAVAIAPCRSVTTRGLVAAGSCTCQAPNPPTGPIELLRTEPVFLPTGLNPVAAACGGTTGNVCNAWLCLCAAQVEGDLTSAAAQAYCV